MGFGLARSGIDHELRSARQRRVVERGEADELPAVRAVSAGRERSAGRRTPLVTLTRFPIPEVIRRRPAVGLGADHDMALLDAQRAHRFGAVGHDPEFRARREHRLPHGAAGVGGHVDFVGELSGIAHPEKPGRDETRVGAQLARADGEKREDLVRQVDVDDFPEHEARGRAGHRGGRPIARSPTSRTPRAPASRPAAAFRDAAAP
jgi:hypothetical protein